MRFSPALLMRSQGSSSSSSSSGSSVSGLFPPSLSPLPSCDFAASALALKSAHFSKKEAMISAASSPWYGSMWKPLILRFETYV